MVLRWLAMFPALPSPMAQSTCSTPPLSLSQPYRFPPPNSWSHADDGNLGHGTAVVGDVSGTTITYGSEYVFNAAGTGSVSGAAFSPTQFVVAYRDNGNSSTAPW